MKQTGNAALHGVKIASDILREIVFFPLWWYTKGLYKVAVSLKDLLAGEAQASGFFVWLKNIHRPMYGQYDWAGRLISFLVRPFQVIVRGILLLVWTLIVLTLFIVWVAAPFFVIYQILFQLGIAGPFYIL